MSWSIPEPLPAVKDHPLPFRAQIGRESDGRPPTSSSIERFTGGRVRYQCHGVFLSRYRQLRTIPYHFELRSAEKATDAPTSSSIERFTGGRVRYQCHGVFLSRYRQLRTIPYQFELRSAEKATDAPQPRPRSKNSLEGDIDTNIMEHF